MRKADHHAHLYLCVCKELPGNSGMARVYAYGSKSVLLCFLAHSGDLFHRNDWAEGCVINELREFFLAHCSSRFLLIVASCLLFLFTLIFQQCSFLCTFEQVKAASSFMHETGYYISLAKEILKRVSCLKSPILR